jgi:hypothetical protein
MRPKERCPTCNKEYNLYANKSPAYAYCPCGRRQRIVNNDANGLTFSKVQCDCRTIVYMEGSGHVYEFAADEQMPNYIKIAMEFDKQKKKEEYNLLQVALHEAKSALAVGVEGGKKSLKVIGEVIDDAKK